MTNNHTQPAEQVVVHTQPAEQVVVIVMAPDNGDNHLVGEERDDHLVGEERGRRG